MNSTNRNKIYHKDIIKQNVNAELFSFLVNRSLNIEQIKNMPKINLVYIMEGHQLSCVLFVNFRVFIQVPGKGLKMKMFKLTSEGLVLE